MTAPQLNPLLKLRVLRRLDWIVRFFGRRVRRARFVAEQRWSRGLTEVPAAVPWQMDRHIFLHGVVFVKGTVGVPRAQVERIDVVGHGGAIHAVAELNSTDGGETGFEARFFAETYDSDGAGLSVIQPDGQRFTLADLSLRGLRSDGYHDLTARFFTSLREKGASSGGTVVEIGARARSGNVRRELIHPMNYCGVDILDGPNVDIVCDAHDLRAKLEPGRFDAAFSISTFEHLAMPWKAAIELNYILKVGAQALIASHQTFPIHDGPWDFWRFSRESWAALFNEHTGFRIVETAYGEPAEITARFPHPPTMGLHAQPAFIGSVALIEKIGESALRWDVPISTIAQGEYPA